MPRPLIIREVASAADGRGCRDPQGNLRQRESPGKRTPLGAPCLALGEPSRRGRGETLGDKRVEDTERARPE